MRVRGVLRATVACAFVLALAAPAAEAAKIGWGPSMFGRDAWLRVTAEPGEQNQLRIVASGGTDQMPTVVTVHDATATLENEVTTQPQPGDCEDRSCAVPCRIDRSGHRARCVITDGYRIDGNRNPLRPEHSFSHVFVDLGGDGPDRLKVPAVSTTTLYSVRGSGGGGRYSIARSSTSIDVTTGDRVNFRAKALGLVLVQGTGVRANTIDGGSQRIQCAEDSNPRLRVDPLDSVESTCGSDVIPPQVADYPRFDVPDHRYVLQILRDTVWPCPPEMFTPCPE